MTDIRSYENIATQLSSSLEARMKDLEGLLKKINDNKITNPETSKNELHTIMVQIEDDINKVDTSIDSLNQKIDKLKEDEITLYNEIKKSYFNLSDEEIKNEIQSYLKKLNLS
jgi:chromosome segregation ATPase